ncbi:hypothetical protein EIP91_006377 [Steccherinum ochraceum]|uniref:Transmembrane protein n=1 Tax=Steccherinum ochraceum TaxID=92696 RepID=A0A4R0R5S9_9APHY|nr:hypothetical protein EIP91_006377 [Steccherinum ochraceum]
MFLLHLLYAGGVALMTLVGMVNNSGLTTHQVFGLVAIPAFLFIRSLYVDITRPIPQVDLEVPASNFLSSVATSPVTVTSLIVRPPSLVPSVIVPTSTDLAVIPTACKALLVLETAKPLVARVEVEDDCQWPSTDPITLIFTDALVQALASTSIQSSQDNAPSAQDKPSPAVRSTATPSFVFMVASTVLCAYGSYLFTAYVLSRCHVTVGSGEDGVMVSLEERQTASSIVSELKAVDEALEALRRLITETSWLGASDLSRQCQELELTARELEEAECNANIFRLAEKMEVALLCRDDFPFELLDFDEMIAQPPPAFNVEEEEDY